MTHVSTVEESELQNLAKAILEKKIKSILLTGESGSGKEYAAQVFREAHGRSVPFVTLNCASLNNELYESELFGHQKGSYTGATFRRLGVFEQADKGILFLDEVACLSLRAQAALLRAIELGEINPLGGKAKQVDVTIITATNEDFEKIVKIGKFRHDLYQRLCGYTIKIPSFFQRSEGSRSAIVKALVERLQKTTKIAYNIDREAKNLLINHPFRCGNIRELWHTLQRMAVHSSGLFLTKESFFQSICFDKIDYKESVYEASWRMREDILFLDFLKTFENKNSETLSPTSLAKKMGLSRFKFMQKIKSLYRSNMLPDVFFYMLPKDI